jgi:GNAT superfamily N-acetyltransferase
MSTITITNTRPEHIAQLVAHQRICFPTLDPSEWMRAEHFASHLRLFPAGQHVALDGERVIGQSSTFRIAGERALVQHEYMDILGQSFFTNHDPQGEWLYGADMSVHPDYRGRKVSAMLYDARKALVRRLGLRGMVAGGMIPGYKEHRAVMPANSATRRSRRSCAPASRCAAFYAATSRPANSATTRRCSCGTTRIGGPNRDRRSFAARI